MRAKLASVVAVLALLALLPSESTADQLPFLLHGSLGYGKMFEDSAPDGGIGFGVGIIYPLQDLPIAVGADLGYQMFGKEERSFSVPGATAKAEAKMSSIPITGRAYYMFPSGDNLNLYGVAGLGFYNMRWSADATASAEGFSFAISESGSETEFGLNGGLGARFGDPDAQLTFGFELKYHMVMTEGKNTNVITAHGRVFFH